MSIQNVTKELRVELFDAKSVTRHKTSNHRVEDQTKRLDLHSNLSRIAVEARGTGRACTRT